MNCQYKGCPKEAKWFIYHKRIGRWVCDEHEDLIARENIRRSEDDNTGG